MTFEMDLIYEPPHKGMTAKSFLKLYSLASSNKRKEPKFSHDRTIIILLLSPKNNLPKVIDRRNARNVKSHIINALA